MTMPRRPGSAEGEKVSRITDHDMALHLMRDNEQLRAQLPRWRKIEDESPPINKTPVLVWDGDQVDILVRTGQGWHYSWLSPQSYNYQSEKYVETLTHWMPLPEPPK